MFIENENNYMAKIAINKSLLKEYKTNTDPRVVYMNNGDEFQIQLFNPETETIGAEIFINGKAIPGILVIRPGERFWLERYLTEQSKFTFTTYEVDDPESTNNSSIAKAIAFNGDVEIRFYREKQKPVFYNDPIRWTAKSSAIDKIADYSWSTGSSDNILLNATCATATGAADNILNTLTTTFNSEIKAFDDCKVTAEASYDTTASLSVDSYNDSVTVTTNNTAGNTRCGSPKRLFTKTVSNNTLDLENAYKASTPCAATIETGRIGKGTYSNQRLEQVDIEFNTYWFKCEKIKILPMSRKPYTANDLQKMYCTNCGRKLNTKYKYCPYCGAKCI